MNGAHVSLRAVVFCGRASLPGWSEFREQFNEGLDAGKMARLGTCGQMADFTEFFLLRCPSLRFFARARPEIVEGVGGDAACAI